MPHVNGFMHGATRRATDQTSLNGANGVNTTTVHPEKTDYTRWRLKDDRGCQTWHYLGSDEELKAWPQSTADKYFLGLETVSLRPEYSLSSVEAYRSSCAQILTMFIIEPTEAQAREDPPRICAQWRHLLLPTTTTLWQLGLRIWWPHVPVAWYDYCSLLN